MLPILELQDVSIVAITVCTLAQVLLYLSST